MSRFFKRQDSDSDSSSDESEEELLSSGDEKPTAPSSSAPKPMSRFLRGAGDDSSDSSESPSEVEESSGDEGPAASKPTKSRFIKGAQSDDDDSDDDDDVKRVVKSAKDKRADEIAAISKAIDNAAKINDWVTINNGKSISRTLDASHLMSAVFN